MSLPSQTPNPRLLRINHRHCFLLQDYPHLKKKNKNIIGSRVFFCIWFLNMTFSKSFHGHTSSVQFSHSDVSNSLWPHESQHARLPVHHQLPEFIQTHVHWVGDAIQPSHPLLSPSPPAPNPSQHQGLFQWVNSLHAVAKVLEFELQHQSFQWTPRQTYHLILLKSYILLYCFITGYITVSSRILLKMLQLIFLYMHGWAHIYLKDQP